MSYKALIDVDVFEDVLRKRTGWVESKKILHLVENGQINGWISSLTKAILYFLCVKRVGEKKARELVKKITVGFSEIPLRHEINDRAIHCELPSYVDNIQFESAKQFHLDEIITWNKKHYKQNKVPVYTPEEFITLFYKKNQPIGNIPFLDLKAQHHKIYNEIDDRITDIIANTGFILGKHVNEFEERFAALQGAKYCIGVSSGTDALHVALLALGVGPGHRVIVPVNTFIATAEAVSLTGAVPIFIDIDPGTYDLDVKKLKEILAGNACAGGAGKEDIKAIIPVHLYGRPANMSAIMALAEEYGLKIIEDCCQAHLAKYDGQLVGNFGEFGAFSFYPGKNLGAYGEAGALITNDEELYQKAKLFRQHGELKRYHHQVIGHNYRMAAFQGAALCAKLGYLNQWTEERRNNAKIYNELLGDVAGIQIPEELNKTYCVYHLYVIQTGQRDGLQKYLQEQGVASGLHYPLPLHMQEAYKFMGHKQGDFPLAEKAAGKILSLPMYPELTEKQIQYVVDKIKQYPPLSQ